MKKIIFIICSVLALSSCSNDFVETEFYQSKEQETITSVEELQAFVYGIYGAMIGMPYYGADYIMYGEIRSDEMFSNRGSGYYNAVAANTMTSANGNAGGTYNNIYVVVAKTNIVINTPDAGIKWSKSTDPAEIQHKVNYLKAQAYALRALAIFDLMRLYGQQYSGGSLGVVMPLQYDPKGVKARSSLAENRTQIENDFTKALQLMQYYADNSLEKYANKTELNTLSVKGLMTRYYLYKNDMGKVRTLVNDIVSSNKYSVVAKDLFITSFSLQNASPNSIFELYIGTPNARPDLGLNAMMNSKGGYKNVVMKTSAIAKYAAGDIRKTGITVVSSGGFMDYKYSDISGIDNVRVCRLEEILLNGAEAELNGGSTSKALDYLNMIARNRGIPDYTSVDMQLIKDERIRELTGEGFRMWDLLRWGNNLPFTESNGSPNPAKDWILGTNRVAFPIPQSETNVAGTPVVSNPGYDN